MFGSQNTAATGSTGGFGGFAFGGSQQTQAPQTGTSGGGFGFGTAAGNSAGGGLSLGTTTPGSALFGSVKPTTTTTAAPAATTGFAGFGSTDAAKTSGGSLLGGLLSSTTSAAAPTVPAPVTSAVAGGGFNFGTPATTAAAPSGFSFGQTAATTAATPATSGFGFGPAAATTAATTAATSGFGFGPTAATTAATTAVTSAQLIGFSFPGTTSQASTSAPTLGGGVGLGSVFSTPSTTTTSATSAPVPSSVASLSGTSLPGQKPMSFRQLEETINKWTTELDEQEKYFLDQATQVNAWDRIVMENGEKIVQLNKDVEKVKLDQQKLDHELDFIHSQQRELEDILSPLERALDSLPPITYQQHADIEREHTYMLAESLDAQLKRMGQDLKEIIERLNSANATPDPDDPVQQVTKILNAHVVSLMWVDRNTASLQRRVEEISKQVDSEKREQERNFRLAYS
ncbi:hypothetical protein BsWGS_18902 [Bradybaena similaris]